MATTALKAKTLKFQWIKLDKKQKTELSQHKIIHTQYLRQASQH